jgi:RES domain-containing protein
MIFTALNQTMVYRMHVPKWAVAPTSGAGAGMHGGRANRVGVNALYLALDAQSAISEYKNVSTLLPPGTLVSYRVTAAPIVDFTGGYRQGVWAPLWESFFCDWRACWFGERIEPPSWVLGDEVIASGAKGLLFRSSLTASGINLVLYVDQFDEDDRIEVIDPAGMLPKNQESWS